jgi:hypothetical protein
MCKTDVVGIFASNLVVYLNKGDGTFAAGVSYGLGLASQGSTLNSFDISFADFNGDGKTDVAVSTADRANMEIVFLGNGDGTFQTPRTSGGIPVPCASALAISGDFNGDGKPDLTLNCPNSIPVGVYILAGNGDGTFQAPTFSIPNVGGPMAAADLNGDGKLDLVVQVGAITGQIFLGNGGGTFSNACSSGGFYAVHRMRIWQRDEFTFPDRVRNTLWDLHDYRDGDLGDSHPQHSPASDRPVERNEQGRACVQKVDGINNLVD